MNTKFWDFKIAPLWCKPCLHSSTRVCRVSWPLIIRIIHALDSWPSINHTKFCSFKLISHQILRINGDIKNITIILTSIYIITEHAHRFHNNNNNNNLHWFQLKKEQRKPPRPCKVLGNLQRKFALNDLEVHVERQSAEVF